MASTTPRSPDPLAARISVGGSQRRGGFARALLTLLLLAALGAGGWYGWERWQLYTGMGFELRIESAKGLKVGSPVQISGVEAGRISEIRFDKSPKDPARLLPVLTVSVRRSFAPALRADLSADVTAPLLLGKPALVIEPGSSQAPPIEEGALIDLAPAEPPGTIDRLAQGIREFFGSEEGQEESARQQVLEQLDALVTEVQNLRERVDRLENAARADRRNAPALP